MKRGVIGVAIGLAGFQPLIDCRGRSDLYGHKMHFTVRALADQLADAAHIVMGECDESTPFVLIRNAPVVFTHDSIDPQSMIMPLEEDLFVQILRKFDQIS
jgi:coenzyme F420-0:L-glutamate ligase/coenzyme F420-1:gamma-L-glutamate ligase